MTLSDGKSVRLDSSGFSLYRAVPNRDDRQKVMAEFFGALGKFRGTFGSTLNGQVQSDMFYARARKYDSALEAALDGPNIPTSVYTRLIDGVNRHLPTFHRYLKLRQRMMKLPDLHYYDLYAPLVASVDLTYSIDEAQKIVLKSLEPLGPEYAAGAKRAFTERWTDFYPTEGKRSGAYSNGGAYDVHPYMLHQLQRQVHGHEHRGPRARPHDAELLLEQDAAVPTASVSDLRGRGGLDFQRGAADRLHAQDDQGRRHEAVAARQLSRRHQVTVFRQTQFAEFELRMHEMAEKGEPLTGEALDKLYVDITKKYYGHDKSVCMVDDYIAHEWAFIPHFYRNFYVFQYATSFTASAALSEKVMAGDPEALKRYLAFLTAGGSKYPDRAAEGRRRRHDDRRAARADDQEDEPGDGRDGEAAEVAPNCSSAPRQSF